MEHLNGEDGQVPIINFTFDTALESFALPGKTWLEANDKHWDGVATSAIVFKPTPGKTTDQSQTVVEDRMLLVQRAAHDSMPNKWESPGGAVDSTDATIMHGCARELFEEAGIEAEHFTRVLGETEDQEPGSVFMNSRGTKVICRFTFMVEARIPNERLMEEHILKVTLDPNEHQNWVWATEREIRQKKVDGLVIELTAQSQWNICMEAFRWKKLERQREEEMLRGKGA